jgi:translation initiation factor 3 subunit H
MATAAVVDKEKEVATGKVRLQGHVVLRIVNHCQAALPNIVHGQLMGLDVDDVLEVTACYPMLQREEDGEDTTTVAQAEADEYNVEMMQKLRQVNVDSNNVGWYCSSWSEQHNTVDIIQTQYSYQAEMGHNCVCLVYDPLRTTQGKLSIKAYRLTKKFMELYKGADFSHEALKKVELTAADIFQEVKLEIQNSQLVQVFLAELSADKRFRDEQYTGDSSEMPRSSYLVKSLESLSDNVDEFFNSISNYGRRQNPHARVQQADKKPSRLETVLLARGMESHCDYIESTAKNTFEDLFFAQAVQSTPDKSEHH